MSGQVNRCHNPYKDSGCSLGGGGGGHLAVMVVSGLNTFQDSCNVLILCFLTFLLLS